jgi:hypothetical protein
MLRCSFKVACVAGSNTIVALNVQNALSGLTNMATSSKIRGDMVAWWRRAVPDSLSRAQDYRQRAEECRRLAAQAATSDVRAEYEELARNYDELAQAEISLANDAPHNKAI